MILLIVMIVMVMIMMMVVDGGDDYDNDGLQQMGGESGYRAGTW